MSKWSTDQGKGDLYIKQFNDGGQLHVHSVNGLVTGANYRSSTFDKQGTPISNYEASMMDLRDGLVKKNSSW